MGNTVTTDASPLTFEELKTLPRPAQPPPADVQWNVKAWRYRCEQEVWTQGDPVALGCGSALDIEARYSYLVMLCRRRGSPPAAFVGVASAAQLLNETCSADGLRQPFSLAYDWHRDKAREGQCPQTLCTLYLFNGLGASAMTKARAMVAGLELERMLAERWWFADAAVGGGAPAPCPPAGIPAAPPAHQHAPPLSTPRDDIPVHLLATIAGDPPQQQRPSSAQRPRHSPAQQRGLDGPLLDGHPREAWGPGVGVGARPPLRPSFATLPPPAAVDDSERVWDEKLEEQRTREKLQFWAPLVSEVESYLAVSGQEPAENLEKLVAAKITHVLNTVEMLVDCRYREHLSYYPMRMFDAFNEDISTFFPHAIALIEKVRRTDGKLLVHCLQGASRSCTLILCYIMWRDGKAFSDAYDYLRERRGIAKPNLGFHTRLMIWERHLRDPDAVQVYRLQGYSAECPVPLVMALERWGKRGVAPGLDQRAVYLIVALPAAPASAREDAGPSAWLWCGATACDALVPHAEQLGGDVLRYAYRTSDDWPRGADPIAWPAGWVTPQGGVGPDVARVVEGREPAALAAALATAGAAAPATQHAVYDDCYADAAGLASRHAAFASEQRAQDDGEVARAVARSTDLQSLKEQQSLQKSDRMRLSATQQSVPVSSIGSFSARTATEATPRLRGEKLDITAIFFRRGESGDFDAQAFHGFDDEEYESFQDQHSDDVCVFLKCRSSVRLYVCDAWLGSAWPKQGTAAGRMGAEKFADDTIKHFRKWLSSGRGGPEWGEDVNWDLIEPLWCHDQHDDDRDVRFVGRWVRD